MADNPSADELFLPGPVRACLNTLLESGEIQAQPSTMSIADNKRTFKVQMTWEINQEVRQEIDRQWRRQQEKDWREQERKRREREWQKRQHEREIRQVGHYTKLKQIARSHGRNRGQPNSNHQNTYAKFQPYPAIKEEPTDNYQIPAAFSTAALPVKEERVESSIRGEESMASDTGSWQEVKKKPRNRRSRRKNKAAGTQTNTVGTDEIGEELSDMLNSLCHFEAPSLLSPIKEESK